MEQNDWNKRSGSKRLRTGKNNGKNAHFKLPAYQGAHKNENKKSLKNSNFFLFYSQAKMLGRNGVDLRRIVAQELIP